jgi:hypothetical protein
MRYSTQHAGILLLSQGQPNKCCAVNILSYLYMPIMQLHVQCLKFTLACSPGEQQADATAQQAAAMLCAVPLQSCRAAAVLPCASC